MPSAPSASTWAAGDSERPPSEDELAARFGTSSVKPREIRMLGRWLASVGPPRSLEETADALERGARWLFAGARQIAGETGATARLRLLLAVLREVPPRRVQFSAHLGSVLAGTDASGFLESGL